MIFTKSVDTQYKAMRSVFVLGLQGRPTQIDNNFFLSKKTALAGNLRFSEAMHEPSIRTMGTDTHMKVRDSFYNTVTKKV